jgi:MSHA biogenesis protein MshJ
VNLQYKMTKREKLIGLAAGICVISFAWFNLVLEPMLGSREQFVLRTSSENLLAVDAEARLVALSSGRVSGSSQDSSQILANVLEEIELVNKQLETATTTLMQSEKMLMVLRFLLEQHENLTLLQFKTMKAEMVTVNNDVAGVETGLFRHRVNLQCEGSFQSIVTYLKSIEQLPWPIYWVGVEYQERQYPKANLSLLIDTYSTERDWIKL